MAPPSGWFSTCPVSQFRCVSECIWKYGYFQQVVACLLTLLWLVCVYMAFSGYTLGKVMRVLYAKGLCNAKNHGCQRPKRQPQIMWPFRTATVRFSIITSSKTVAANDCDNNRQLAVAIWPHKPEVLLSRELRQIVSKFQLWQVQESAPKWSQQRPNTVQYYSIVFSSALPVYMYLYNHGKCQNDIFTLLSQ